MEKKLTRRQALSLLSGICLLRILPIYGTSLSSSKLIAIRIWPASAYTRVTLESQTQIDYKYFYLQNPERLVLDLQNTRLNQVVKTISDKILKNDPYIAQARVGQYNENTVRIVFDLKKRIKPQLFTLKPVSSFKNRLVVDLYPSTVLQEDDPLLALLQEYNRGGVSTNGETIGPTSGYVKKEDSLGKKITEILDPRRRPIKPTSRVGTVVEASSSSQDIQIMQPVGTRKSKEIIVVLDPGHGGEDPGAIGALGTREKDVVLDIARRVHSELRKKGLKVHMTRDEDVFVPLRVRVAKARKLKASIFVSIHADSFNNPTSRGTGVYALSQKGATNEVARYLAQTQNRADEIGGVKKVGDKNVDSTLFALTQTATINRSLSLGNVLLRELGKVNQLHKKTVDQANFAVLKAPDIPSVLVESAFISNPIEEHLLRGNAFKARIARSISEGVLSFVQTLKVKA
ncbi:MAG: N-acetylmuramoyl-L-alanine amidase [Neisseriaceae bacterium]